MAHHCSGDLEMAREWARRAVRLSRTICPVGLPCFDAALMGDDAEAKAAVKALLELDPQFSITASSAIIRSPCTTGRDVLRRLRRAGFRISAAPRVPRNCRV